MRKIKHLLCPCLWILCLAACTEENFDYSDTTDIAMFTVETCRFAVTDAVADNVIDLEVSSPVLSDKPRSYVVKLMAGTDPEVDAIEHTNFEMASSLVVTIPAGKYSGTFQMRAFHHTLYDDRDKLVTFTLAAMEEEHPVAAFNNTLTVSLSKVCVVNALSELAGTYTLTSYVSLLKDDKNKVYNLKAYADPDYPDGLIIEHPYSEDNLVLRLWLNENGRYTVTSRRDVYMGTVLTDSEGKEFETEGTASGEYNPCNHQFELNMFLHPVGDASGGGMATDIFVKN